MQGRGVALARIAWVLAGISVVAAVLDTLIIAAVTPLLSEDAVALHGWPFAAGATAGSAVMGALIVSRHARHPIGWLLLLCGVPAGISLVLEAYSFWVDEGGPGSESISDWAAWFSTLMGGPLALTGLSLIFLIAPDGRFASRRWRLVAWLAALGLAAFLIGIFATPPDRVYLNDGPPDAEVDPFVAVMSSVGFVSISVALVASAICVVVRLQRAEGEQRLRLRWITFAASALAIGVSWYLVALIVTGEQSWWASIPLFAAYLFLPVCIAIAVLRHRLFDVDLIINRTLVVAFATAAVAGAYVVLVVVLGAAVGGSADFWPSLLATVVVALAFQPVRQYVVRLADRLAFGEHAAPYEALAAFSRHLGEHPDPESLLPSVAKSTAGAVAARSVTARLLLPDGAEITSRWPSSPPLDRPPDHEQPVLDGAEPVGALEVAMPPGRRLRPADRTLLADLAEQAALAFGNARLQGALVGQVRQLQSHADALAASRQRLIEARDTERRRLESAIRAEVLPPLEPLPDELARLGALPGGGRRTAAMNQLTDRVTTSLESLRQITRGVYPVQLSRSGLTAALARQLAASRPPGRLVTPPAADTRFPPAAEATAYFAVVEAARCLRAPLTVELGEPGQNRLWLRVSGRLRGRLDVVQIRDRVEALGGTVSEQADGDQAAVEITVPVPEAASPGVAPSALGAPA